MRGRWTSGLCEAVRGLQGMVGDRCVCMYVVIIDKLWKLVNFVDIVKMLYTHICVLIISAICYFIYTLTLLTCSPVTRISSDSSYCCVGPKLTETELSICVPLDVSTVNVHLQ